MTKAIPPMNLTTLPRDGADYGCGFRVPFDQSVRGDGLCRRKATKATSMRFIAETDLMAHRAICDAHVAHLLEMNFDG